ncbi:DeoR/GlpR transcriptional regulator [Flaviflexus ciconiae]|uniref:Lactose phosphotransferase system repressor n=1 Tax=Flaviflexus ciconiae TaxID=2496867 RepID=A0A3Q9G2E8_9ACTO|nr:DeoR/GlpR family DNA-binding transcription regulator [Flaviflexus ciconiae]AZQ76062.1 DeoR/GlpR transcriptional regulator [Flaviflexus ciconiae]
MLAQERRSLILEDLRTQGGVETDDIAQRYGVSVETVRRDLLELEKLALLKRVYGGAISIAVTSRSEAPHSERENIASEQKAQIAERVAELIPESGTVFLDLGTTVEAVARAFPSSFSGTIVTASLRAVGTLSRLERAEIIVSGGRLRKSELSLSGTMATSFLDGLYPDLAVISIGAITADAGVTDYDFDEMHVKQSVLANSQTAVVVADSSKFGKTAPFKLCDVEIPTYIATDSGLDQSAIDALKDRGAQLLLADA